MAPLGLSAYKLAKDTHVPISRIQAIVSERRAISGDTALRLARYFGTTPEFWLNLQRDYDLEKAMIEAGDQITATVHPRAA
ncbi:addiction module antidote protein, HigA family [Rhodospira trueperi]|uniref:Addiction module antidote protein, HigA family n=2 Tax=Rhodospira trueperi TaxID=69960 RepID=A0A1G6YRS4_9PROT|nr:addiction module antidote protein, HigA family [Rhodospira trueperi]